MKSLFLRAIEGEEIERPPVWLMRQAGRYMHEYRALKEQHGFLGLCRNPELAAEVSMQPIEFLDVDAAIIFSDILIPLEAIGIDFEFSPGPVIQNPIKKPEDIGKLKQFNKDKDSLYVSEAISLLKKKLEDHGGNKALLGFAGAPWTLACYVIDRGPFKHFESATNFAKQNPEDTHKLLEHLADTVSTFLLQQIEAGADTVQLFDSWGGILSTTDYLEFSFPYLEKIINKVQSTGTPCILYVGNNHHLLPTLKNSTANCISLDWKTPLSEARETLGDKFCLQGNLNPSDLYGSAQHVRNKTKEMLADYKQTSHYVANLGHGILQTTPRENAKAFVDTIKEGWVKD